MFFTAELTREACIGAYKQAGEGVEQKGEEGRRGIQLQVENTGAELRRRRLVLISGPFYNMSTNKCPHSNTFCMLPHQSLKSIYRVAELLLSARNV